MKLRNFVAQWQYIRAPETADSEFAVTHQLQDEGAVGIAPRGMKVIRRSHAASLYESGTTWTTTTAYLKCDTAGAAFHVIFFT